MSRVHKSWLKIFYQLFCWRELTHTHNLFHFQRISRALEPNEMEFYLCASECISFSSVRLTVLSLHVFCGFKFVCLAKNSINFHLDFFFKLILEPCCLYRKFMFVVKKESLRFVRFHLQLKQTNESEAYNNGSMC